MIAAPIALGCSSKGGGDRGADASEAAKREPGIALELAPLRGANELSVTVRVTGPQAAAIKELRVARAWADTHGALAVHDVEVSDARGSMRAGPPVDDGPDSVYPLARPPAGGELVVRYRANGAGVDAPTAPGLPAIRKSSRLALHVTDDRVAGVGHSFLLLPAFEAPLPAKVRWRLDSLGPGAQGASSFGAGEEVTAMATPEDLAHAMYIAGRLQAAESATPEKMVMLGNPELDVGAVLEWTRGVVGHTKRLFEEPAGAKAGPGSATQAKPDALPEPFYFLLVAEPGMGREHDGAHLTRSLGLWFDEARALDPRLRVAIAHEILHEYIGASVRLVDGGKDATWFSEGFTAHYARYLLFKERLITPDDFIEDLRRSLDPGPARDGDGRHEGYTRGALYAAYLDAALRKRSGGVRSLDDIVRELLATARRDASPKQPASLFRDLVVRELGPEGGDDFDHLIARADKSVEPPAGAFGPCFKRADRKEPVFELGFDPTSLRGDPILIRGVVKGSAAERAGLREGDLALTAKVPEPAVALAKKGKGRDVQLTISGRRGGRKIRYRPIGEQNVMRWETKRCKR